MNNMILISQWEFTLSHVVDVVVAINLFFSAEMLKMKSDKQNLFGFISYSIIKEEFNVNPIIIIIYLFSCTSRYVGEFCEYANPCLTAPRCQNGGTCQVIVKDGQPNFECKCPMGFSASLCEISEETACSSSPCQNGGHCLLKSLKEHECKCLEGFSGKFSLLKFLCFVLLLHHFIALLRQALRKVQFVCFYAMQKWRNVFHAPKW